jgi:hypothetical protein
MEALLHDDLPLDKRVRLMTQLKTANEAVMGTMDAAVDRMAERVEAATVLHGKQLAGLRSEVAQQSLDWVASEVGFKTVLDPVLVGGKLLMTGVAALSAHQDRKVQLEDVKTFHSVAAEVQAELSKVRRQATIPQTNPVQSTESPVRQDRVPSPEELLADSLMQAQLRDI